MPEIEEIQNISYKKKGPGLNEALSRADTSYNLRSQRFGEDTDWDDQERTFSEREGLENLASFINLVIATAERSTLPEAKDIADRAKAFRENLVFITTADLNEAIEGLASDLLREVKSGKEVYIDVAGNRSERYISLLLAEAFSEMTESDPDARGHLHISRNPTHIAEACASKADGEYLIVVPDDFSLSHNRIKAFASKAFTPLLEAGVSSKSAAKAIRAYLVAMPLKASLATSPLKVRSLVEDYPLVKGDPTEEVLNVNAYFKVHEYRKQEGKRHVYTGVSISGSHCSVDYGYEGVLKEFFTFLTESGVNTQFPLLTNITRPYELEKDDFSFTPSFRDSLLQERWVKILDQYGL